MTPEIETQLDSSKTLVLFLSERYMAFGWCQKEQKRIRLYQTADNQYHDQILNLADDLADKVKSR